MKLVDTNVLVYAVDDTSTYHEVSRRWLDGALSGRDTVAWSWQALTGFVRVVTRTATFPHALSVDEAVDRVESWLGARASVLVQPTARHSSILRDLLNGSGSTGGNLVNDAHLAALAIEHRASIVSFDSDFARFPGIAWSRPS